LSSTSGFPSRGKILTQATAEEIQAKNFNHATQDLYEAIEKGDYPEWEFCVQIMSDDEHLELDFDPLDPTKIWPVDTFPLPIGRMVLDKILPTILPRLSRSHLVQCIS